jgi:hypothetical protein
MAWGAFAALRQPNIKRLMAYSSIGNVGYVLLGVASGSEKGIQGVVFYLAIYMVMTLGVFAVILLMKRRNIMVESISDLAGPRSAAIRCLPSPCCCSCSRSRHPAARRLLGQALRLHGGRRGQAVLARHPGVLAVGRGVLLLPAHRQGDVLRRGHRGARPQAFNVNRAVALSRRCWWRCSRCCRSPERHRRRRRQGPVPVTSKPVLPDGWTLVALHSVGSTNDEAARLAEAGASEGTVVWAREQTGGRGRRGRVWASPVGNLYTSTDHAACVPGGSARPSSASSRRSRWRTWCRPAARCG